MKILKNIVLLFLLLFFVKENSFAYDIDMYKSFKERDNKIYQKYILKSEKLDDFFHKKSKNYITDYEFSIMDPTFCNSNNDFYTKEENTWIECNYRTLNQLNIKRTFEEIEEGIEGNGNCLSTYSLENLKKKKILQRIFKTRNGFFEFWNPFYTQSKLNKDLHWFHNCFVKKEYTSLDLTKIWIIKAYLEYWSILPKYNRLVLEQDRKMIKEDFKSRLNHQGIKDEDFPKYVDIAVDRNKIRESSIYKTLKLLNNLKDYYKTYKEINKSKLVSFYKREKKFTPQETTAFLFNIGEDKIKSQLEDLIKGDTEFALWTDSLSLAWNYYQFLDLLNLWVSSENIKISIWEAAKEESALLSKASAVELQKLILISIGILGDKYYFTPKEIDEYLGKMIYYLYIQKEKRMNQ